MTTNTTFFQDKNGFNSSVRVGGGSWETLTKLSNGSSHTTFNNKNLTTRVSSKKPSIGTGIKIGKSTTYFGQHGSVVSSLPALSSYNPAKNITKSFKTTTNKSFRSI